MGRERHKPEEIIAKLRQVDVLTAQGTPVAEATRSISVTEVTYYRWGQEYVQCCAKLQSSKGTIWVPAGRE